MSKSFKKSLPSVKHTEYDGNHRHKTQLGHDKCRKHLQTLAIRPAKNLISGYGYNADFYETAIEKLRSKIGKPTKVVSEYLLHLQRLQHPTFEQPTSFKDFLNFLSTMVDTFKQLCFHHDLQSTANVEQVLKKLPITARLEWNRHALAAKLERPKLSRIAEWIEEHANACEDLPNITTKLPGTNYAQNSSDRQKGKNSQQQVEVKIRNLCFNCLSPHLFEDCKSNTTCRQPGCDKRHHTLLHQDGQPATITATTTLNRAMRSPSLLPILPVTMSSGSKHWTPTLFWTPGVLLRYWPMPPQDNLFLPWNPTKQKQWLGFIHLMNSYLHIFKSR